MATTTRTKVWISGDTLTAADLNAEFNGLLGALGLVNADISGSAAIVFSKLDSATVAGVSASQTLTNKTLTSPAINTPTITTPVVRNWDGWQEANDTWVYLSATEMNTSVDWSSKLGPGDKVKFTQTTAKYGIVASVSSNRITLIGNTDYVVANATITSPYISHEANPVGFPHSFTFAPTCNFTIGNGTLTGKFRVNGRLLNLFINFTFGSSSAFIAGNNIIAAPVGSGAASIGVAYLLDSGTLEYVGAVTISAGSNSLTGVPHATAGAITSTQPFTWATNDQIRYAIEYEI